MVIERLRPEAKPENISDLDWERSKCDKSPTGAHWFAEKSNELRCRFCGKHHTKIWRPKSSLAVYFPDSAKKRGNDRRGES